jgi:hypothetical protein
VEVDHFRSAILLPFATLLDVSRDSYLQAILAQSELHKISFSVVVFKMHFDSHGLGTGVSRDGNSTLHMRYHLASSRESYKSSLGILFLTNSALYLMIQFFISSSSSLSSRHVRKILKASSSSSVLSQSMASRVGSGASATQVL